MLDIDSAYFYYGGMHHVVDTIADRSTVRSKCGRTFTGVRDVRSNGELIAQNVCRKCYAQEKIDKDFDFR